jgi:hypothetical protein
MVVSGVTGVRDKFKNDQLSIKDSITGKINED